MRQIETHKVCKLALTCKHTETHTPSFLNYICPVKLPKLLFLILPLKSKAGGVIHNLRIFSFFASKCKWESLFYKRLIERHSEEDVASHRFPAATRLSEKFFFLHAPAMLQFLTLQESDADEGMIDQE